MTAPPVRSSPAAIWWILWAATLSALVAFYTVLKPSSPDQSFAGLRFLPLFPFIAAVVVRWLLLPRFRQRARAFPIFVIGLSLAEACALMGIFLVPDLRTLYFILAIVGLLQYVPIFLASLED